MNKYHWPANNLGELISFLSRQHNGEIRVVAVSEKVGVSPQAISNMLLRDDAMLSSVEKIANAYGYSLYLHFPAAPDPIHNVYRRETSGAGMLADLFEYIYARNYNPASLSVKVGCNRSVMDRALRCGDIKVSTLNTILRVLGISMTWEWVPSYDANRPQQT